MSEVERNPLGPGLIVDPGRALRGTWDDPAIIKDARIPHTNEQVRYCAERLHNRESLHMHDYIQGVVCPYCALRASVILAASVEYRHLNAPDAVGPQDPPQTDVGQDTSGAARSGACPGGGVRP